ncbi:unnamed protein product [Spirodela intermedia]|uniref:Uncharacterized protein n=2 Tax=Spirodela intermedia TaxID=51605 RepID=A0A7I8K972_SPIIN|nr:unnamed protein product [Spirodela intermedia]CAA7394329.1 unnamed protein product [Spirodela intermedia]CAA7394342.1 unnamed protein product [Spirodela intermedia]
MHRNPERSRGSSCSVHGLEGSPWTKTTWAISRSSPILVAMLRESRCHLAEWKNGDFAALRRLRWRLVSWRIVLFLTTACLSINQR